MKKLFYIILASMILCCLFSCKTTKYVPVETVRTEIKTDTVKSNIFKYDTIEKYDSIYLKDSIFVHSKNDTIYVEKWHTKIVNSRQKAASNSAKDSIEYKYIYKTDSVTIEDVEKVEEVESQLKEAQEQAQGYHKTSQVYRWLLLISLVLLVATNYKLIWSGIKKLIALISKLI